MNPDVTKRNLVTFDVKYKLDVSDMIFNNEIKLEIVNIDPLIIVVHNLLTKSQCDQLIAKTCKIKYGSMQNEYPKTIRDNKRILCMSDELADGLWKQIKDKLSDLKELKNIKPDGFGTDGEWAPKTINSCFRFSEYNGPSVGFKPHRDTTYIKDFNNRSVFTMIGYLNDTDNDFTGGSTTFYKIIGNRKKGQTVEEEMKDKHRIFYEYKPVAGTAILFNHNTIHCGEPINKGTKYIFRTDIVFSGGIKQYKITGIDFQTAIELTRQAQIYEMRGEIKKAGECFERAVSIRQCQNDLWCADNKIYIPKSNIGVNYEKLLSCFPLFI
ncbi:MAG: hypothetical protein Edafosvirus2_98 [Edafosvirus sp.]|uniref:Fe2OG dioxygenase domain-containing protein n=1 Tax=Edafosvirus sp. TaxID=2487765 RepID=A0A3G4ZWW6_9VIRU|nr:MAG: hypothetical protein Edafosvirus2_98 [Edafosvirus sp.]